MTIRKLGSTEIDTFLQLLQVFETVFEMENFSIPSTAHLSKVLEKEDFLVWVAEVNHQVIGGLTAYVLDQYYSEKPLAYLYDLGVNPEYQRQGIGKVLISSLTDYCFENRFEEVFVQAYANDIAAVEFYRATGASELSFLQFSYSSKPNQLKNIEFK
jgi:aminoglycoside 3-N-acetyltransferase I